MRRKKIIQVDKDTGETIHTPRIDTPLSAKTREKIYEKGGGESLTVPGQTMTIQEMLDRHRKGLPIDESKGALYQGDELMPDLSTMDEIDRAAYMDSVADALVDLKAKIAASAKTKQEKEIIDRIDVAVREKLKELAEKQQNRNEITDIPQG